MKSEAPSHHGYRFPPEISGHATSAGTYLYAFDKATGEEVWRGATPYRTSGNPMTYRPRSGRQYVVIATGAGPDAALVAFALPGA